MGPGYATDGLIHFISSHQCDSSTKGIQKKLKPNHPTPDYALALDSNPCYEASNVKQTEAQEAVHVYETVKQHN
jgi:hypothetical protein